jgi:hypothetical protein
MKGRCGETRVAVMFVELEVSTSRPTRFSFDCLSYLDCSVPVSLTYFNTYDPLQSCCLLSVRLRMAADSTDGVPEASRRIQLIKFPNAPSPGLYPFPMEDFAVLQDIRDIMPV